MRRTKIICTVGPSVYSQDAIEQLLVSGMDAARLNFSHGTYENHAQAVTWLRAASKRVRKPLSIIGDLQGPKIRTGENQGGKPIPLATGQRLIITTDLVEGTQEMISATYPHLPEDVQPGDRILLDDGMLELHVLSTDKEKRVYTEVVVGGLLGAHKGINLPGVNLRAKALTVKDQADLEFAIQAGVDYVALMITHPRPTRAEASDVANAIYDGADAIMLSGETASGRYPIDALTTMDRIVRATEQQIAKEHPKIPPDPTTFPAEFPEVICSIACRAAWESGAKLIALHTMRGLTARLLSHFRPRVPVVAFSPHQEIRRRLALLWGVIPCLMDRVDTSESLIRCVEEELLTQGLAQRGDRIVILFGAPLLAASHTNSLHLHTIP